MKSAFFPLLLGLLLSFSLPHLGLRQASQWLLSETSGQSEMAWLATDSCRLPVSPTLLSPPPPISSVPVTPVDTLVSPFTGSLGVWVNWLALAL